MKKTHRSKRLLIIALICLSLLSVSVSVAIAMESKSSQGVVLSEINIKEEYFIGSEFEVPSATLTLNGEEIQADVTVVYPDGSKHTSKSFSLAQVGRYTIEYSAYFNGVKYTKEVSFLVSQPLYEVKNNRLGSAIYNAENQVTEFDNSISKISGVLVDLPAGGEFVFNEVIDFSNKTRMDSFVNFVILPNTVGDKDIEYLYVKLTDIHDADNYVIISYHDTDNSAVEYGVTMMAPSQHASNLGQMVDYSYVFTRAFVKAGCAYQPQVGIEGSLIHKGGIYGYPDGGTSFHGTPTIDVGTALCNGYVREHITSVALDYQSKGVYTNDGLVTDLDDASLYTDKWEGFTTGEAYLSIYAGTYTDADSAKILITDIAGFDLSQNKFIDKSAPVLSVDFGELDKNNLPNGVTGFYYPVFSATAIDSIDGVVDVKVTAYYNYNSSNKSICNIVNGKITLKRSGLYTFIYEAEDNSGNKSVIRCDFNVIESMQEMTLSLQNENESYAYVGNRVQLSDVTVANYVENYDTQISVLCNGKNYEVRNGAFIPNQVGEYIVRYTVTDFIGRSAVSESKLSVSGERSPVFFERAVFPQGLIEGKEYNLPNLIAYDYSNSNNGEENEVEIYLTDENGRNKLTEYSFIPNVATSGDNVIVEYRATNEYGTEIVEYEIPCYIVENEEGLDLTKFFILNGDLTLTPSNSSTAFTTQSNKTGFKFLNALLSNGVDINFSVNPKANNFTAINFYLTDSLDEGIQIKISFYKEGTTSTVRINDSKEIYLLNSSFTNERFNFYLRFNEFINTVTTNYDESVNISVTKTLNGEDFNGFTSGKVYLSAQFLGVIGKSEIKVSKICGQPITSTTRDNIKPMVSVLGEYDTSYKLNETIRLYKAVAGDVLDPEVTLDMTVRNPNGDYLQDVNGVILKNVPALEYQIKLESYGAYSIVYNVKDSSGKNNLHKLTIRVFDDIAPEIVINGSINSFAKQGDVVQLATASASDNVGESVKVYVYVEDPRGVRTQAVGGEKENYGLTVNLKGTYKVIYYAVDGSFNATSKTFEIVVE